MALSFSKMHGLGNDFVVIDGVRQQVSLDRVTVARIADRHTGIGCDQLLLVEAARNDQSDFRYRIFNADGGEVEQCGNGARCFARFVRDQGLTDLDTIRVETSGGPLVLQLLQNGNVVVDMGVPVLEPAMIPFEADARADRYTLETGLGSFEIGAVSMGNPHAILIVDDPRQAPVAELGAMIEHHPRFERRVNVGFVGIEARDRIRLRVHERGVGETLACGSGACAAVVSGRLQGLLDERVEVTLNGGKLVISWIGEGHPVLMTGPATHVFKGTIEL